MNILDSSGWIEYFTRGKNFDIFAPIAKDFDNLLVPTIILVDVLKFIHREDGEIDTHTALEIIRNADFIPLSEEVALLAVDATFEYKLPLADSIIMATAKASNAILWTQDGHFENIEGVKYFPK